MGAIGITARPALFGKKNGSTKPAIRWLLAPSVAAVWLTTTGRLFASALVLLARLIVGVESRGTALIATPARRIYVANHTSHADFIALWAAMPPHIRRTTHPVAAADYWQRGPIRRYVAKHVLGAVLVDRSARSRHPLEPQFAALRRGESLVLFPEGTRGNGNQVSPFKCGIYHLAREFPEIEIVPVWLANLNRVLPRGAILPAPLLCSVTFGHATRLGANESKAEFLDRLRQTVVSTGESCSNFS